MRNVLVVAFSMAAGFGCGVCQAVAPDSQSICATAAGGLGLAINGGNESYSSLSCDVARDGGSLALSIAGTQCSISTTAPLHAQGAAPCDLSTAPAGTYSTLVAGTTTQVTLPFANDGGTLPCPGGI
jgi:hypothetical protein